jgi:hypothetical protein
VLVNPVLSPLVVCPRTYAFIHYEELVVKWDMKEMGEESNITWKTNADKLNRVQSLKCTTEGCSVYGLGIKMKGTAMTCILNRTHNWEQRLWTSGCWVKSTYVLPSFAYASLQTVMRIMRFWRLAGTRESSSLKVSLPDPTPTLHLYQRNSCVMNIVTPH